MGVQGRARKNRVPRPAPRGPPRRNPSLAARRSGPHGSLLSGVGASAGPAQGPAEAARLPQLVSPEPAELGPRPRAPRASRASSSAGPEAPETQGTAAPSPPTHLEIPGYGPVRDGGPSTPPVTAQNTSFGPVPPASAPTPASSSALLESPSVPQEVTETPLASASSPAPDPAPPDDPVTQGGPGTPRGDAAGGRSGPLARLHPRGLGSAGDGGAPRVCHVQPVSQRRASGDGRDHLGAFRLRELGWASENNGAPGQGSSEPGRTPETAGSRPEPETGARPLASLGVGDTALAPGSPFGETKP